MTGHHRNLVTERRHYNSRNFSSSSVVSRAFSALCVYLTFRHHPHPLSYLYAKCRFFHGLHCSASPRRRIAYSINHPVYYMRREPKLSLRNKSRATRHKTEPNVSRSSEACKCYVLARVLRHTLLLL